MLQRRVSPQGFVYYISPLLERIQVPHAFSTRIGGTSPPPFDSFNLGNPSGVEQQDDFARIYHHFDQLQQEAGVPGRKRLWVHQVHGSTVITVRPNDNFESGPKADALVSNDPTRTLSVRIADCVPILLATADGKTVAAIHAGWRGVIAGAVPNAIQAMQQLQHSPPHAAGHSLSIRAAIGPSITKENFEVGPEVLDQFEKTFNNPTLLTRKPTGKGQVDLRGAIHQQLIEAGLPKENIDTTDRCTYRDAEEFFSHRRDKGVTGRMAAIISPKTSPRAS